MYACKHDKNAIKPYKALSHLTIFFILRVESGENVVAALRLFELRIYS